MQTIKLGSEVPKKGNAFTAALGRLVFKMLGWKLAGEIAKHARI